MTQNTADWPDLTKAIKDDKKNYNQRYKSWTSKTTYDKLSARDKELHLEMKTRTYWNKRIKSGKAALCYYTLSGRPRLNVCRDMVRIRNVDGLPRGWIGTYDEAVEAAEIHRLNPHEPDEDEDEEEMEDDVIENDGEDVTSNNEDEVVEDQTSASDNTHGVNPAELLLDSTYPGPADSVCNHHTAKRARAHPAKSHGQETITPSFNIDGFVAKGQVEYNITDTTLRITASEGIEIKSMKMSDRFQVFFNGQQLFDQGVSPAAAPVNDQRTGHKRKHRDEKENDNDAEADVAEGAHDDDCTLVNADD